MKNIWTNGCFDILHIGHIELFRYAKSLGDKLVVGIDADDRVKRLKGPSRPINNQQDRKKFLESIKYIDKVVIFSSSDGLVSEIKINNIDLIVVGDDYRNQKVIGSECVDEVIFFPKIPNLSTSAILNGSKQ
jgi:D-beta-D-heptose 7-phosphate kinase/D-beta-D-heptose 1-phosphate adenosyltransferase